MRDQPPRQPYVFGPVALLRRVFRWHLHAPLWQQATMTAVLAAFILLTLLTRR